MPTLEQYPGYYPAGSKPFWTRTKVGAAAGIVGQIDLQEHVQRRLPRLCGGVERVGRLRGWQHRVAQRSPVACEVVDAGRDARAVRVGCVAGPGRLLTRDVR